MRVLKRNGQYEPVSFDKVLRRIANFCNNLVIDPCEIGQQVCSRIYDGVKTTELDELTAQFFASRVTDHPDYGILASRITISNHQKKGHDEQQDDQHHSSIMMRGQVRLFTEW